MSSHRQNKASYDQFGAAYHAKRKNPSESFWNDQIDLPAMTKLVKPEVAGASVLDLGCGSGLFTKKIVGWGGSVVGLDLSEKMLELAKREVPGVEFHQGRADRTGLKARRFDVIVSCLMLHYFEKLGPLFRECSRLLKPKGVMAFSFHHPFMEVLTIESKGGGFKAKASPYFHGDRYEWTMLKGMSVTSYHHTFEAVFAALSAAGFVVECLLEPQPNPKAREVNPKAFARTSAFPIFCAIKAVKY